MIIHTAEQGTDAWLALRLGKPTASRFKDILTPGGKASTRAETYMHTLIAERLAGKPLESYQNEWMARGTELEPQARTYYELVRDREVTQVGFVTNDDETIGCSPDGLIESGGLEIKCPKAETHVKYLLSGQCPTEYLPQVQGCMWLCERDTWDFLSYHPDLPPLILTVERDDEYISKLEGVLGAFLDTMNANLKQLEAA